MKKERKRKKGKRRKGGKLRERAREREKEKEFYFQLCRIIKLIFSFYLFFFT